MDCDGVLLDWEAGFIEFLDKYKEFDPQHYYPYHYKIEDRFPTITNIVELVSIFNISAGIGYLTPVRVKRHVPPVKRVLHRLIDAGYAVEVATSAGLSNYSTDLRQKNLNTLFGLDLALHSLPLHQKKAEYFNLSPNQSIVAVVDDNIEQLIAWKDKYDQQIEIYFLMTTTANAQEIDKRRDEIRNLNFYIVESLSEINVYL